MQYVTVFTIKKINTLKQVCPSLLFIVSLIVLHNIRYSSFSFIIDNGGITAFLYDILHESRLATSTYRNKKSTGKLHVEVLYNI